LFAYSNIYHKYGLFCWDVGVHGHNAAGTQDETRTTGEVTAVRRHCPVRQVGYQLQRQEEMLPVAAQSYMLSLVVKLITSSVSLLWHSIVPRWHGKTRPLVATRAAGIFNKSMLKTPQIKMVCEDDYGYATQLKH